MGDTVPLGLTVPMPESPSFNKERTRELDEILRRSKDKTAGMVVAFDPLLEALVIDERQEFVLSDMERVEWASPDALVFVEQWFRYEASVTCISNSPNWAAGIAAALGGIIGLAMGVQLAYLLPLASYPRLLFLPPAAVVGWIGYRLALPLDTCIKRVRILALSRSKPSLPPSLLHEM
ncbi:MAG: hypothetical protein WCJ13_10550 [Coriobacteriia bacterium]